jgi:hypothetical protein
MRGAVPGGAARGPAQVAAITAVAALGALASLAALASLGALAALAACSFPTKHGGTGDAGIDAETPFGCTGLPFGTRAPAQIMISGQALDLGTGVPAAGTAVAGMLDTGAAVFTRTTDASGNFSALLDTGGKALAGYVVTTAGSYAPAYFYPAHPFDRDSVTPLPVLTAMELTQVGNPANTSLAQLILGDCPGMGLEACTLAIVPTPQRIEYSRNGTPDTTATATDATGYVLVYGLVPGMVTFQATCPSGPLRETSLNVVGNATYFIRIEP